METSAANHSTIQPAPASRADQHKSGKALRGKVSRSSQRSFVPSEGRDPVATLCAQNTDRVPDLVPLRRERMSESPFAFYRGAAAVMAADLANEPHTALQLQIGGDAHLSNFGVFASRDRDLDFDINDFDETATGPWEWDLKRLCASIQILGEQLGMKPKKLSKAVRSVATAYREDIAKLVQMSATDRYFMRIDALDLVGQIGKNGASKAGASDATKSLQKATQNTSARALTKLATVEAGGGYRIVDQPPLTSRLPEFDHKKAAALAEDYKKSVPQDIQQIMEQFTFQDAVVKVVGVGSVGTRCLLWLFADADGGPLFLQVKEAVESVIEEHTEPSRWGYGGERVVAGQRIMQASGDPFLGNFTSSDGRSYYVRQFRDMKGGIDPTTLKRPRDIALYGRVCASALARAHSQSGLAPTISAYVGATPTTNVFDRAIADFAKAYAKQNALDLKALRAATDEQWYQPAKKSDSKKPDSTKSDSTKSDSADQPPAKG